jgi:hypothetical protein
MVALGRDAVAMVSAAYTTMESALEADRPPLSATLTVKFDVPAAVGVPAIAPAALSDSPAGSEPPASVHA